MKVRSPFKSFVDSTQRHFQFLLDEYGFRLIGTDVAAYEAWLTFDNVTTRVTVTYEMGSPPWVEIARREHRNGKYVAQDEISLELLLEEPGKHDVKASAEYGDIADEALDSMLAAKASSLREQGSDLLRGNFESLPRLRQKAEENLKKRNLELFGSETGETP